LTGENGQFIKSFDYRAKKLVLLKAYNKLIKVEMTYHHGMKTGGWKNYNGNNPYKEHYRDENWEALLKKAPAMKNDR
jgi:hypothetical protein